MPRKKKPPPPCFRCWFLHELIARGCHPEECYDLEMWLLTVTPIQIDKYFLSSEEVSDLPEMVKPIKQESWLKKLIRKVV